MTMLKIEQGDANKADIIWSFSNICCSFQGRLFGVWQEKPFRSFSGLSYKLKTGHKQGCKGSGETGHPVLCGGSGRLARRIEAPKGLCMVHC